MPIQEKPFTRRFEVIALVKIRKANLKDVPRIVELDRELINYHYELEAPFTQKVFELDEKTADKAWKKYFRGRIRSRKALVLVAEDKNQVIAYAVASIQDWPPVFKTKKCGKIDELFVLKPYRNQKVGKRLIQETEKFFRRHKLKFAWLNVDSGNHQAIKKYLKLGFQEFRKEMVKGFD
jgi:ribosomal protein S18 acetylase RimI-like enzyme